MPAALIESMPDSRLRSHPASPYSASASRPASVISIQLTLISRCPAGTVRCSEVASPLFTKSCSVPIPKPCVRRMDSVVPFGLPASILNASRCSKGIAMPVRIARLPSPPGAQTRWCPENLSRGPIRLGPLEPRGVTTPANPASGKP
jgi:hypothetical protein